jgi:hypothetical protein
MTFGPLGVGWECSSIMVFSIQLPPLPHCRQ